MKMVEQMLFALLRASLHNQLIETYYFKNVSFRDWEQCFRLAKSQGVMALAWDGILKLPSALQPPLELKLQWGIKVEAQEKKYQRYCRAIHELTSFYQEHQIATLQLKGVGLSTLYPIPSHREGGDIDIYTYSAEPSKISDKEANCLADELMRKLGIEVNTSSYKHSNFHYKGIPIENHRCFLNIKHYQIAKQINGWLMKDLQPQPTPLLNGEYQIWTPSPTFNTLFLAFHAAQHYGSGLALHHLCDWAMLIHRHGLQLPQELTDKRFIEAICAFTQLCNRYLGTQIKVEGGEELADKILEEVLRPRFPHKGAVTMEGKLNILIYKTRRFLHCSKISNQILYIPLWKRIWKSAVAHILHPKTIFQMGSK